MSQGMAHHVFVIKQHHSRGMAARVGLTLLA
jgi:hypothetical protein